MMLIMITGENDKLIGSKSIQEGVISIIELTLYVPG